jgi:hypothetical protein
MFASRKWAAWLLLAACLAACQPALPPAEQFQTPAVGTPVPPGMTTLPIALPALDASGVMFVNQTGATVQVVVSDTITAIESSFGFLFILPAGTHEFYIYEAGSDPWAHSETIEAGKVRYVHLVVPAPAPP